MSLYRLRFDKSPASADEHPWRMDPTNRVAAVLGDALRRRRHRGRWRQLDVGERARVSQAMISRMELGGGGPIALDTWAEVAAAAALGSRRSFCRRRLPMNPRRQPDAATRLSPRRLEEAVGPR